MKYNLGNSAILYRRHYERESNMNAILFLIKEHDKMRTMLAKISYESHQGETKRKIFTELCQELIRHETMEQEVWYPFLIGNDNLVGIIKHLVSEEEKAAETIKEFDKIEDQKDWEEKFLHFKGDIEHHASDEETKLFPIVEKHLTKEQLEKIGKIMYEFKQNNG